MTGTLSQIEEARKGRVKTSTEERSRPIGVLIGTTLGFFAGFAGVNVFGPLVPHFADQFQLSSVAAATLAAIPSLSGALLRIPCGAFAEMFGPRRVILSLLLTTAVGVAGLLALLALQPARPLPNAFPLLLLLGIVVGSGIAVFSAAAGQVSAWSPPDQRGRMLAIFAGLGNTAPAVSALLLPLAASAVGLVGGYALWLAALGILTACYAALAPDAPRHPAGRPWTARATLIAAARRFEVWGLTAGYFVSFGGYLGLVAWLPSYWHHTYGFSLREAGVLTAVFSLTAAGARAIGGAATARVPVRLVVVSTYGVLAAAVVVLARTTTVSTTVGSLLVVAAAMGVGSATVFRILAERLPHMVAAASGVVSGLGALGGFVLPPLMAEIADLNRAEYAPGFLPVAGLALLVLPAVLLAAGGRRRGHCVEADSSPASSRHSAARAARRSACVGS
ncbi:MAG: MFS transporter [Acidothermus sp.]|nr:MFS transporter [Acidothermus sp.]